MLFRLTLMILLALPLAACGPNLVPLEMKRASLEAAAERDMLVYVAQEAIGRRADFDYTTQVYGSMRIEATYVEPDAAGCQAIPVRRTWWRDTGSSFIGRYTVEVCPQGHPQPSVKTVAEYREAPKEKR